MILIVPHACNGQKAKNPEARPAFRRRARIRAGNGYPARQAHAPEETVRSRQDLLTQHTPLSRRVPGSETELASHLDFHNG
jgi:hypothetical protein